MLVGMNLALGFCRAIGPIFGRFYVGYFSNVCVLHGYKILRISYYYSISVIIAIPEP